MSRIARSARLLKNAEAALISAIEIYNKPAFGYREETFAILALNAWELLLKAKVLAQHNNALSSLQVSATKKLASGAMSKKKFVKVNRTGNKMTIGIEASIDLLAKKGVAVPQPVRKNLEALTEIRDNAVHYINASRRSRSKSWKLARPACVTSSSLGSSGSAWIFPVIVCI